MNPANKSYHHGDLRRALLDEAVLAITENGLPSLSLRDLARRVGVSHAASSHHFGDKSGLLTALAVEGFEMLTAALRRTYEESGSFLEVGVAYVRFAIEHPAHFEVMFRPDLHRLDADSLAAAKNMARAQLYPPAAKLVGDDSSRSISSSLAAWALVHGLATLWLNGALPDEAGPDPEELTRLTASHLFGDTGVGTG